MLMANMAGDNRTEVDPVCFSDQVDPPLWNELLGERREEVRILRQGF